MATYGNTTKYLLRKLLGSNTINDIDAGFAALADDVDANMSGYAEGTFAGKPAAGKTGRIYRCTDTGQWLADTGAAWVDLNAAPALVSSLPGSPFDGQEIYYSADPTNGVVWHLRYRSAASGSYKWEFVGGGVLTAEIATQENTSAGGYSDLSTVGPSITVPLAGDYEVSFSCEMNFGSTHQTFAAPKFGSAATLDADAVQLSSGALWPTLARTIRRNVSASSQVVKLQYKSNTTGGILRRNLQLRPIRVG